MKHFFVITVFLVGFVSCNTKPKVIIKTSFGDIVCELYKEDAPVTVTNFLKYADENRYDGSVFYRVVTMDNQPDNKVKIEVVQGGLFSDDHPLMLSPIEHEPTNKTGIRHQDGTLSMARMEPGTASSEFFICVGDQPELDFGGQRNVDGRGFAAFGKVIKGMDVVRMIHSLKSSDQMLDEKVVIETIKRF